MKHYQFKSASPNLVPRAFPFEFSPPKFKGKNPGNEVAHHPSTYCMPIHFCFLRGGCLLERGAYQGLDMAGIGEGFLSGTGCGTYRRGGSYHGLGAVLIGEGASYQRLSTVLIGDGVLIMDWVQCSLERGPLIRD